MSMQRTAPLERFAEPLLTAASCALEAEDRIAHAHIKQAAALSGRGAASERRAPTALPAWRTHKIVAYIEENLSDPIDLRRLADVVGLSRRHLSKIFKRRFGLTLGRYIRCRRVARAQTLMLASDEPLCEIALRCGMCDQAHFARVFRELVGETPSRWRKAGAAVPVGPAGVTVETSQIHSVRAGLSSSDR